MKKLLTFLVLSTAALCCKLALAGIVSINNNAPRGGHWRGPGGEPRAQIFWFRVLPSPGEEFLPHILDNTGLPKKCFYSVDKI